MVYVGFELFQDQEHTQQSERWLAMSQETLSELIKQLQRAEKLLILG